MDFSFCFFEDFFIVVNFFFFFGWRDLCFLKLFLKMMLLFKGLLFVFDFKFKLLLFEFLSWYFNGKFLVKFSGLIMFFISWFLFLLWVRKFFWNGMWIKFFGLLKVLMINGYLVWFCFWIVLLVIKGIFLMVWLSFVFGLNLDVWNLEIFVFVFD